MFEKFEKWIKAETEASENLKRGETKQFTCPICGGDAFVGKSSYNGHKLSYCRNCKMRIIE